MRHAIKLAHLKSMAYNLGCTVRYRDGEYRVNLIQGSEAQAYYTNCALDALGTMEAMRQHADEQVKTASALQVETYTAPSDWASYYINGDASGLEDEEIAQADAWIEHIGYGTPVGCEDAGFIHWHDARVVGALAADCQTYTFLHR